MSGAILLTLGHPAHGRETEALELVNAFLGHVDAALEDRELTAFRWYGFEDGDLSREAATIVLEGSREQLDTFSSGVEFRELRYGAPSFLQDFTVRRARPPDTPGEDGVSLLTSVFERWGLVEE